MEEPTGRHYIISALKRQYTDRLPITVLIGPYCSKLTNYTVKEILTDARKSAEAHLAFYDRFKPDSLVVYNDIYLELEAIGCKLEFPEDNISHPKAPILEEKSQLAGLKVPDPKKDGRLPYFIELCERVSTQVRKTATMGLGHSGPWNLAMHLRGAEQLMLESITEPEFVHELMRFTTEVVRTVGDALIEAGFSPSLGEACASCSLISPQIYRDFIKPYHKELRDYFSSKRAPHGPPYMRIHRPHYGGYHRYRDQFYQSGCPLIPKKSGGLIQWQGDDHGQRADGLIRHWSPTGNGRGHQQLH